ncbi:MAG: hypothetical protein ACR2PH_08770 [Desulfobulbia bacterium]
MGTLQHINIFEMGSNLIGDELALSAVAVVLGILMPREKKAAE